MDEHYNSQVRHRDFKVRDLVPRKVMGAARDPTQGKLGPNWEGPYRITSWQRNGTYHLEMIDGQKLPHPWNTEHLWKYYQWKGWHEELHPFISSLILAILLNFSIYFSFWYNNFFKAQRVGFCFLFKELLFCECMAIRGFYSKNSWIFYSQIHSTQKVKFTKSITGMRL